MIGKKNIEYSIKDGLVVTVTKTAIFYTLKAPNVKPPTASMDAMDIMELAGGICAAILMKDYAVYKKWMNE